MSDNTGNLNEPNENVKPIKDEIVEKAQPLVQELNVQWAEQKSKFQKLDEVTKGVVSLAILGGIVYFGARAGSRAGTKAATKVLVKDISGITGNALKGTQEFAQASANYAEIAFENAEVSYSNLQQACKELAEVAEKVDKTMPIMDQLFGAAKSKGKK